MSDSKRMERLRKHIVTCPHCGKEALDHMTRCPSCGGTLTPRGYNPTMSEESRKRFKRTVSWILWPIAIALIVFYFVRMFLIAQ